MKSIKQLIRQPIKLAIGILLVSLSVAILIICIGQCSASKLTKSNLDDRYTTIGLVSSEYLKEKTNNGIKYLSNLPAGILEWIERLIWNHTDIVKTASSTGLVSAYIPELSIDNFSQYENGYKMSSYNTGYPYRCAMLTVTLTKIGTVGTEDIDTAGVMMQELLMSTTYLCVGTVESVIGLDEGFAPPVGQTIVLHIKVFNQENFDALDLRIGQKYLVYGEDYCDGKKSSYITLIRNNKNAYEELFGKLRHKNGFPNYEPILNQFDCVMTVCDPTSLPIYTPAFDKNGGISKFVILQDQREVYYQDGANIKIKKIPVDDFIANYQLPTITSLNGSIAEFLTSEEGTLWQEALDKMEINNHAFPVLCVDKLGYQAVFAREQARIVDGRDFTEGELLDGEKVCILSQTVATKSKLQIGDTIELRTYAYDPTFEVQRHEMMMGTSFPSAALYSEALGFTSEMETYTIVGLYRQEDAWQNSYDAYGFTPNTIFIPKTSVTSEMIIREKGIYSTLVLENGKVDELQNLMTEAGYPDLFICYDQGYSEFVASLDAYEDVSEKALYIGLAAYAVLMLLFVFLFPMMQRKTLTTMFSFGAPRKKRMGHICVSSAAILLPGTVLGAFAGSKLWTQVADRLMQSLNIEIPLEANMPVIVPTFAAAHLLLMALVIMFTAIILTKNNSVMKCK